MKKQDIYIYSILIKQLNNPNLNFIRIETPLCDLSDFCEMIQQQIRSGEIPLDGNIVSINLSGVRTVLDWSEAPKNTQAYAIDKNGSANWYIGGIPQACTVEGKYLMEGFMERVPAPFVDLECGWYESLICRPAQEIKNEQS